jgi:hypothetical protein
LHSPQPLGDFEDHVVTTALTYGAIHVEAELDCLMHDRGFRDVALLVGREHATDASRGIGWAVS